MTAPRDIPANPALDRRVAASQLPRLWAKCQAEAAQIADIDDPLARNRLISAAYAGMYLAAPEIKWSGLAAFASKDVGAKLDDLKALPLRPILARTNKQIFADIYPVLKFWQLASRSAGPHEAADFIENLPDSVAHPDLKDAVHDLKRGKVKRAAQRMIRHEQGNVAQAAAYESPTLRAALAVNRLTGQRIDKIGLEMSAQRADPKSGSPHYIPFTPAHGRMEHYPDRERYAGELFERFCQLEDDHAGHGHLQRELTAIAAAPAASASLPQGTPPAGGLGARMRRFARLG